MGLLSRCAIALTSSFRGALDEVEDQASRKGKPDPRQLEPH